ncbi:antitoxin Xre/MbcA/ParS toxin-binding domain-containing protein [Phenylobacterium sp.]
MGGAAREWLQRPLPALDDHSPAWLLAHHPQGARVVRAFVMRMPR